MNWKIILIMILLLILVIFTTQNYGVVEIRFLFWAFHTSKAIILFVSLMIGIIMGWFLCLARRT